MIILIFSHFCSIVIYGFDLGPWMDRNSFSMGFRSNKWMDRLSLLNERSVNNYVDWDQDFSLRNKRNRRRRCRTVSWSSKQPRSKSRLEPRWVWSISCKSGSWTISQRNTSWTLQTSSGSSYIVCSVIWSEQCSPELIKIVTLS